MAETQHRVSVVVPTHNRGGILKDNIASILNQDFDDYEVIYVNDGSTDNTEDILRSAADSSRVPLRVAHVQNAGPGQARNAGAKIAQGEVLLFADDDVTVPKDWIRKMLDAFEGCGCDALCGGFTPHSLNTKAGLYMHHRMRILFGDVAKQITAAPMMNFMIPKSTFDKIGGFIDKRLVAAEDWEFCLRMKSRGLKLFYEPSIAVVHRYQTDLSGAKRRIHDMGSAGVYVYHKHKKSVTAYVAYATLRFVCSPIWLLRRYPLGLYGFALRMEYVFWRERVKAYMKVLRGKAEEIVSQPPSA